MDGEIDSWSMSSPSVQSTPLYRALAMRNWTEAEKLLKQGAKIDKHCAELILDLHLSLKGAEGKFLKKAILIKCNL
jgi:hypothetical protein